LFTQERIQFGISETIYEQRITKMKLQNIDTAVELTKSQWADSGKVYQTVHLDIKPITMDTVIYSELSRLNFRLKEKHTNKMTSSRLYSKNPYTVTTYRIEGSVKTLSVELHKLPNTVK
jgi:hypothetical protein